jgi:predicted nucleotidyltransferase component of viral defense system
MKLHENPRLYRQALQATADFMNIREVYIEKDYWVTIALKKIFSDSISEDVVFKGGTALSKCYGIIPRFSEDIDLVVRRRNSESDSAMKRKLKQISELVATEFPEIEIKNVTRKYGLNRKTAHQYVKSTSGDFRQVRDFIIVESSWMGDPEPSVHMELSSYIYTMMVAKNQVKIAQTYDLTPFRVQVLSVERTLCEKIMSLVRFSYSAEPLVALALKIRHAYDIHQMLQDENINMFLSSDKFDDMLITVGKEDNLVFKSNNDWVVKHPAEALFFIDLENVWSNLKSAYEVDFRSMVYGQFPNHYQVYESLDKIKTRLLQLDWIIKI